MNTVIGIFYGWAALATVGDGVTTMRALQNPAIHENNPLLGAHPSVAAVGVVTLGSLALQTTVVRKLPTGPKVVVLLLWGAVETRMLIRNVGNFHD